MTHQSLFFDSLLKRFYSSLGLITAANIVIAVVLRRVSRASIDCRPSESIIKRDSDSHILNQQISTASVHCRPSVNPMPSTDIISATNRRTSTQVTRMLLAVTLSLIICNIPNTIFFVFVKIYDTRQILVGRACTNITDQEINLYKFGFYSSVIQDILSDLPHMFNFFLYCLAGKKFRSIFINEVHQFLLDLHLIKQNQRRLTEGTSFVKPESAYRPGPHSCDKRLSSTIPSSKTRNTVEVLFNGKTTKTLLNHDTKNLLRKKNPRHTLDEQSIPSYTTIQ